MNSSFNFPFSRTQHSPANSRISNSTVKNRSTNPFSLKNTPIVSDSTHLIDTADKALNSSSMKNSANSRAGSNISTNNYNHLANASPFSPNIFSYRRVWVKKQNSIPTTLIVHQNDIIDDLKQEIINKFPNSLARVFDPADLLIKMDLSSRHSTNVNSSNATIIFPKKKKANNQTLSTSPDQTKCPLSPLNPSSAYNYINLEPDQNVWSILDLYYPNGMGMQEALIIETPVIDQRPPTQADANSNANSLHINPRQCFNGSSYTNTDNTTQGSQLAHSNLPPTQQQNQSQVQQTNQQSQLQQSNPSTTPVSANNQPYYHQPKPQYFCNHNSFGNNYLSFPKDRSISPSSNLTKSSPVPSGVNYHRRSYSNPSHSPVSANNSNSQAILLLPKNFSLAAGSNSMSNFQQDKKRLSLDENLVSNNSNNTNSLKSSSILSSNLTNIGIGINVSNTDSHPTPYPISVNQTSSNLPRLDVSKGSSGESNNESSIDSSSTITTSGPENSLIDSAVSQRDRLSASQSPTVETQGLVPPAQGSPDIPKENMGIDGILQNKETGEKLHDKSGIKSTIDPSKNKKKVIKSSKTTTEKVLPSISVLVVEDNAINQAILGAFLRKHKIHYQIAKNGQEAIDKWRKGGFHLVLMDIQLPVKSGIEATKEIRRLEKVNEIGVFAQNKLTNSHYKIPIELKGDEKLDLNVFRSPVIIVALTASSNSSVDKKNALMAGCNDFLTKPVNLVWLQNKITEWGCMQALIDFDGWKTRRPSDTLQYSSSNTIFMNPKSDKATSSAILSNNQKLVRSSQKDIN